MISDEVLYARVCSGDREALVALVDRYHAPLLHFLQRMTGQPQTAEDLVQETFVRLITYRGKPPERFRAWAYTVACNLARDLFRSAAQRRELPDPLEEEVTGQLTPETSSLEACVELDEDCLRAAQALLRLPVAQREIITLRFYHDLRLEEIAEVTRSPLGTVKSRLYLGLKVLKAMLEEEGCVHETIK